MRRYRANPFSNDEWAKADRKRRRNNAAIRKQNKQFERLNKKKNCDPWTGEAKPSWVVKAIWFLLEKEADRRAKRQEELEEEREAQEMLRYLRYVENDYQEPFWDKFHRRYHEYRQSFARDV